MDREGSSESHMQKHTHSFTTVTLKHTHHHTDSPLPKRLFGCYDKNVQK